MGILIMTHGGRGYLVDSILQDLILSNQPFGILTILVTRLLNSLVPEVGGATNKTCLTHHSVMIT